MLNVHHATAKRASEHGVTLTVVDGTRFHAASGNGQHSHDGLDNEPAKDVLSDFLALRMAKAEYACMSIDRDPTSGDAEWHVYVGDEPAEFTAARLEDAVAQALEYCEENEIDIDEPFGGANAAEDDEDREPTTVVAAKYRAEYRARGNPNHCGDWLAQQLHEKFLILDPEGVNHKFDWRKFEGVLIENGVDMTGKWAALPNSGQNHWVGRYRMNGRQKLEKVVASTGKLVLFGVTHTVPTDDLILLWNRHPDAEEAYEATRPKKGGSK